MKNLLMLILLLFVACNKSPIQPGPLFLKEGQIVAHVYFQDQNLSGKKVMLMETNESGLTGADGKYTFHVKPGHYTLRAFDINRGGPTHRDLDFEISVGNEEIKVVEVFDCLVCV